MDRNLKFNLEGGFSHPTVIENQVRWQAFELNMKWRPVIFHEVHRRAVHECDFTVLVHAYRRPSQELEGEFAAACTA